jgi:aspartyl-tRNA(Asn)/glutamyl-tRNA(Gln) amidotransferase subunit C
VLGDVQRLAGLDPLEVAAELLTKLPDADAGRVRRTQRKSARRSNGRPGRKPRAAAEALSRRAFVRLLESPQMIDREQVLHVARLARLELSEDEVARMSKELSAVADYIEKIGELDLEGVPATTHVVEVSNALRRDVVQPSLEREIAFANAPAVADGGFLVPSPQTG